MLLLGANTEDFLNDPNFCDRYQTILLYNNALNMLIESVEATIKVIDTESIKKNYFRPRKLCLHEDNLNWGRLLKMCDNGVHNDYVSSGG